MKLAVIIAVVVGAGATAAAGNPSAVLVAQPVRAPVSPTDVSASEPFVPAAVPEVTGEITVGPDRGAALWLDPLDVIVVRHARGAKLKLSRVVGVASTRASIAESGGAASPELTYLTQPAGRGDVWLIAAAAPTKIVVERPILRSGRAAWEDTQQALLAWVDKGGARPELPITDGTGVLIARLETEATVGAAIEKLAANGGVRSAVRAWRKAGVVAGVTAARPFVTPQLAMESIALSGMGDDVTVPDADVAVPHPYRRVSGPRTLDVELEGPGALRVELRGILPATGATVAMTAPPAVSLAVSSAGQRLANRSLAAGYATARESVLPVAFPRKQPLISSEGSYLGERIAISIPLFPGKHRYAIAIDGGELALRATVARRRVRLGEALGGSDNSDRFVAAARDALGDDRSPAAHLVRRLIDQRAGVVVQAASAPEQLPALLRLAWSAATTQLDDRAALAAARDATAATERDAAWTLVAQLATRAHADGVAALLAVLPGQPPPAIIPELVAALPAATAIERIRNWRQAALDLAWRAQPLDPALAFADRAAWRGGEWALIAPTPRDSDAEPALPQRWLVESRALAEQVRTWRAGDLWQLTLGRNHTVVAAPSAIDPARAALLDVFVAAPANAALRIEVDGKQMDAVALSAVERLQIAVTPGRHRVRLDAPAGTRAWISHTPGAAVRSEQTARIQYYWPVAGMRTVLPTESSSTPIQVALRAVGTKPLRVTLRTDVGAPTEVDLVPGATDTTAHPLAAASATGASISFAVRLPAGSRMVWFETDEPDRLLAAVFVRRARADAVPEPAQRRSAGGADAIDRVTAASRVLARDPDDARSRAERASELLDLGEPALAREDLLRLLRVPAARRTASASIEDDLFARLEGFSEPTHIALVDAPATPLPIAPSSLVLGKRELVEVYANARVELARGNHDEAAAKLVRLYQRTGAWQVAFEAIDASTQTDASALTYGLASRLRGVLDHPRVRRALVVSAAQSGWSTLTSTASNAGQETLFSSEPTLPPAPPVVIREALIAPPWPARSGHTLTSNTTATLDLDAPATTQLFAQVKCVAVKVHAAAKPCALTARIDQGTPRAFTAKRDATVELEIGPLSPGRHVVELALASGSDGDIASARFATDRVIAGITAAGEGGRFPIEIERRGKVFVANAQAPITTSVLGKTTLWVQARAVAPGTAAARSVEIVATPVKGGDPVRATLQLVQERSTARGDAGRELIVSVPSDAFMVLPDAGAYSITVTPDRGEIVARLARREDRNGKVPRTPAAWYVDAPATPASFALPSPPAVAAFEAESFAEPTPRRIGTLWFELGAGQDSYTDEDLLPARARGRIDTIAGHRLALSPDRAWLTTRGLVRAREETSLIAGGASELYLAHLPLDLTAQVRGSALTQAFSLGRAWHVRGDARLTRPFAMTSTLTLLPSVAYAHSWLNTTPATVEVTREEIDPEVFTKYRYAHDRTGSARLAMRWMPLQDFIGTLSIGGASNRDLRSFDYVDASVRLQHLLALPLVGDTYLSAAYHPRYRLADTDRMDAFLQHEVSTRVEWSMWTGGSGRFLFGVWNQVSVTPTATLPAFGASLRFELVGHRGLVDYAPDEAVFTSLLEHRSFARLEAP